jgi:hypothetical protein
MKKLLLILLLLPTIVFGGFKTKPNWGIIYVDNIYERSSGIGIAFNSNLAVLDDKWIGLGASAGRILFDDQSTDILKILSANVLAPASSYYNFGTTSGSSGYGVQDDGGTIKIKNSGGSWATPGTLSVASVELQHLKKNLYVNQTTSADLDTGVVDISGLSYSNPMAIVINKSNWKVSIKAVTTTKVKLYVDQIGSGTILFDLLVIEQD